MITLRFDHVLNVGLSLLLLTGCGGQMGMAPAAAALTPAGQSIGRPAPWPKTDVSLQDEVLSGTYTSTCERTRLVFVASGRAIGPMKGAFLAYGYWQVGPNEWQFEERFKIKSRRKTLAGAVLGTETGGKSTCAAFKDKPLFYFARREEGRARAVIRHERFSRVFLEQFERGWKSSGTSPE
jgi:hypothetical protein